MSNLMIDRMNTEREAYIENPLHTLGWHRMGRCQVFVSIDNGKYHLSISCDGFIPSYNEIKEARYRYCPDGIYMAEIFPPKSEFVNLHKYCRHLWQINPEA